MRSPTLAILPLVPLLLPLALPLSACMHRHESAQSASAESAPSAVVATNRPAARAEAPAHAASPAPSPVAAAAPPAEESAELSAYRKELQAENAPTDDLHEDLALRGGGFRFFYRGRSQAHPQDAGAVSASGAVATMRDRDGWHPLMDLKGSTPAQLAPRFAFLLGNPVVLEKPPAEAPPDARALVQPPAISHDGTTVILTMWVVRPPNMEPSRLRIGVPADNGRAWFDDASWRNVAGER